MGLLRFTTTRGTLAALAILGLIAIAPAARAQTDAATYVSGGTINVSQFTRGWEFTTTNSITVSALGWWDEGGNGLAASHQVSLWTTGGTVLASTTVPAGTGAPLSGGFRYNPITSVVLAPGTYVVAGKSTSTDQVVFELTGGTQMVFAPGITFVRNRHNGANSFSFPSTSQVNIDMGMFAASFQFGSASAPEPGTLALVALGMAGGLVARRRRK